MKAEIIVAPKEFQPIELKLTFETQAEYDAFKAVMHRNSVKIWEVVHGNVACGSATGEDWLSVSRRIHNAIVN